jgi:hypothetical protein
MRECLYIAKAVQLYDAWSCGEGGQHLKALHQPIVPVAAGTVHARGHIFTLDYLCAVYVRV